LLLFTINIFFENKFKTTHHFHMESAAICPIKIDTASPSHSQFITVAVAWKLSKNLSEN